MIGPRVQVDEPTTARDTRANPMQTPEEDRKR